MAAALVTTGLATTLSCKDDGPTYGLPTLGTTEISDITSTEALGGGEITDDGGASVTARGVCWGTNPSPTIADSKTEDGTGIGSFTSTITGLAVNTTYYVRAYATNSAGTAYGNERNFTTAAESGVMTDIDGNVYQTVKIGNQVWMAENLNVTRYNDGTKISKAIGQSAWTGGAGGLRCFLDNDSAANAALYGQLYNWDAVNSGKLAPAGWHVPTKADWDALAEFLGGNLEAGVKLKATTQWNDGATHPGTNSSGFTAFAAGTRSTLGQFANKGTQTVFWSSTQTGSATLHVYSLSLNSAMFTPLTQSSAGRQGYSVRCIKD